MIDETVTYKFCNVTGRSSGMVPPILLLLRSLQIEQSYWSDTLEKIS
jgi:hypothetical protein